MAECISYERILEILYERRLQIVQTGNGDNLYIAGELDILAWIEATIKALKITDIRPERHGHWIICSDGYYPYCSECTKEPLGRKMTDYCPNCGAKMNKGDSE